MNRPTPEELAPGVNGRATLARLTAHGYVIVHPDDVRKRHADPNDDDVRWGAACGWNECRARIFGDA